MNNTLIRITSGFSSKAVLFFSFYCRKLYDQTPFVCVTLLDFAKVLRFYQWTLSSLSVGKFHQITSLETVVNIYLSRSEEKLQPH